ncbi:MAG: discoidin domain-containing protein, partial [Spirochaetia bacterium]|nr:discoidin domain-containing protein [Spirochaetia bacterium]
MNQSIKISHKETLLFSSWKAAGRTDENAGQIVSWVSSEEDRPFITACIGEFDSLKCFNSIQIDFHPDFQDFFPETFRFEISNDGIVWEPMLHEINFHQGIALMGAWNFPLLAARYVKFLFSVNKKNSEGKYFSAFGGFRVMVSGIVNLAVSGELDRLWVKENLTDRRNDYGWSSSLKPDREEEFIQMDLGSVNVVSELRLLSKDDPETFFPSSFRLSYSEDGIAWHHLLEENNFLAEPGTWYKWRFSPVNMQHLKITIDEGAKTREGKYISQIIEVELYATPDIPDKAVSSGSDEPIPYASVLRSGIVRLARDGEFKEGIAVQSSDRRLREGSTEYKGIVELASDGEDRSGVAVQGDDRRLKYATEDLPGIIRLARDGENKANHAVQGNDHRLKHATEDTAGIIELAS